MRKLLNDEAGFIVSAELILVLTIGVLGMVVGLASLRDSLTSELIDLSDAFGAIDQTYNFNSINKFAAGPTMKVHALASGAGYNDQGDDCDCQAISYVDVTGKKDQSNGGANENN